MSLVSFHLSAVLFCWLHSQAVRKLLCSSPFSDDDLASSSQLCASNQLTRILSGSYYNGVSLDQVGSYVNFCTNHYARGGML